MAGLGVPGGGHAMVLGRPAARRQVWSARTTEVSIWRSGTSQYVRRRRPLFHRADDVKAVSLVEADGPVRVGPGSNENGAIRELLEVAQEQTADAVLLTIRADVSVTDQGDVAEGLDAHDTDECSVFSVAPEGDAVVDFMAEFVA